MLSGRPSWEDESHNTNSLFGGPDRLEVLRPIMMGGQNGKHSQRPNSDSLFPSEIHEEYTTLGTDPWYPAGEFSQKGTTWVPQVEPWTNKLPRFSHLVYDPDLKVSDWTLEETDNWMRLNLVASVVWSMRSSRFSHQDEGQHTAGIGAASSHCPMGPSNPPPWVLPNLPRDFFNFLLEEDEEEEEELETQPILPKRRIGRQFKKMGPWFL